MDENLFRGYVPQVMEYTHTNQTKYVSHALNWGSEHLLETRKMKLNRPPLQDIYIMPYAHHAGNADDDPMCGDIFNRYFELKYDDNLDTYMQENTLMCVLKKDSIHNVKCFIIFEDVEKVRIPRPMFRNTTHVFPHTVWKTKTPPTLIVEEYPGSYDAHEGNTRNFGYGKYKLKLLYQKYYETMTPEDVEENRDATYWFMSTLPREPVREGAIDFHDVVPSEDILLDPDHCTDTTIQTLPFDKWMEELPMMWVTFDNLKTLPDLEIRNNIGYHDWPIFSPGTNGYGDHYLYPMLYGSENLPCEPEVFELLGQPTQCSFQVRVYPLFGSFTPGMTDEARAENFGREIGKIEFIQYLTDPFLADADPFQGTELTTKRHVITYNTRNVRLRFVDSGPFQYANWNFRRSVPGDWDYDGTTYINHVYGYINDYVSRRDNTESGIGRVYPIFRIIPNYTIHNQYDWTRNNGVVGLHVDSSTDYSDHGVSKKNGTIHDMGDFDGLPSYYHYRLPRDTARAHTELYAMKDALWSNVHKVMDKRVASLIVDSAVPQNKMTDVLEEMDSAIVYDNTALYPTYHTLEDKIITLMNVMSDICYQSRDQFMDASLDTKDELKHFIYHGNRIFSLSTIGLDPFLERGRVYSLTNDPAVYENNETMTSPKSARTLARICDIPTDFSQLINIKYKAPTIVIDEFYVRTELPYRIEDQERVWWIINNGVLVHLETLTYSDEEPTELISRNYKYLFDPNDDLNELLSYDYLWNHGYFQAYNLNNTIILRNGLMAASESNNQYYWSIQDGGVGYQVGDVLQAYVAGHLLKGTVSSVDASGSVLSIAPLIDENKETIIVPVLNFPNQNNTYECKTASRTSHSSISEGCYLRFVLDIDIWQKASHVGLGIDSLYSWEPIPNMFTFKFDAYGNIWLCTYSHHEYDIETLDEKAYALFKESDHIRDPLDGEDPDEYEAFARNQWLHTTHALREEYRARASWSWEFADQLSGNTLIDNPYDDRTTWNNRSITDILIQNLRRKIMTYQFPGEEEYSGHQNLDYHGMVAKEERFARSLIISDEDLQTILDANPSLNRTSIIMDQLPSYLLKNATIEENMNFTAELIMDDVEYVKITKYIQSTIETQSSKYPAGHAVSQISNGHLPTRLLFGNLYNHDKMQPTVFVYNPFQSKYKIYDESTYNDANVINTIDVSIEEYPIDIWDQRGIYTIAAKYLWKYVGYQSSSDYSMTRIEAKAKELLRDDYPISEIELEEEYEARLQQYWNNPSIQKKYVAQAIAILFKTTYHPNINDEPTPIQLIAKPGDKMTKNETKGSTKLTEQPCGDTQVISTRQYPYQYHGSGNTSYNASLFYFFKLPDDATLAGFKMMDEFTGNDVSNRCIILYQERLFYYNTQTETWTLLRKGQAT
jgi:hypothetical protein